MPHLNDPKLAAQLLSGISFTINHTSRGDFSLQHVKYDCTLSYGDGKPDNGRGSYDKPVSLLGEAKASREASEALAATDDHGEYLQNTR